MKRITVFIISALIVFSLSAVDIAIAPYNAFSGVPVGNSYYHADETGRWTQTSNKWGSSGGTSIKTGQEHNFTNEEMIGVVSVQNSGSNFTIAGSITISATAPNGLYMISQSEPSYKRPIEIWFYPSYGNDTRPSSDSYNKKLSNENPEQIWFATKADTPSGITGSSYKSLWFDVVLALPGTLNPDTNEIEVKDENGNTIYYPLVKASDYSSIITITVTYTPWDGSTPVVSSLTIPFTGYYDPSEGTKIKSATVSMNVTLESTAYNLNLEKQGTLIDIGEITYMAETEKSVVFFSSSSDPFYNGGAFTMVKSGLGVNTQLTSQNSLGFKIRVSKPSGSSLYSSDYIDYDGTLYIDSTLEVSSVTQQTLADKGMIIPVKTTYNPVHQGTKTKYTYSSRIYLIFDTSEVLMLSGRYTEDIYVHVLTYE